MQTAKEHITRPLEDEEIVIIDRGMQYLEDNWEVQRHLEDLHGLQDSSHDPRMQQMNRWRLLPYVPYLGLQVYHVPACMCLFQQSSLPHL